MTYRTGFSSIFLLLLGTVTLRAQDEWKLKTEKEGIRVYTRLFPGSKFKAIKVDVELDATLSQLVAVILDVNTGADWVYSTKSSVLLKQVSPSELYYYSEVNIPWPADNRDFIAQLKAVQDSHTKVVTVYGPVFPDYVPEKKGIVRVRHSEGKWVITPVGSHHVKVEYTLRADPGGDLPPWLVNMFVTKGPYESFKKLKEQLKKPVYVSAKLPFITD
jgi:hypothetical protein